MIDYVRFRSGQWRATCDYCGQQIVTETAEEAYKRGSAHAKVCGR